MLDIINRYTHGFVAVPVIVACKERGLFDLLQHHAPLTSEQIAHQLGANEGHLHVALRMMQSLGWLVRNEGGAYASTAKADYHAEIPANIIDLFHFPMASYLLEGQGGALRPWIERCKERWKVSDPLLADFLDGLLLIPLLIALKKNKAVESPLFSNLSPALQEELADLFISKGWANLAAGDLILTDAGQFMVERDLTTGITASYAPMLSKLPDLLFGDPKVLFESDAAGHESHLDRTLNVLGSGFQHDKLFRDVDEIIISIFNRLPIAEQPIYVADMGCGDGSLLKRVYETIRDKSARGKVLAEYPVQMIGVDVNEQALSVTGQSLANVPHLLLRGDIGNPAELVAALSERGINPAEVLHIRSFLAHDRPFMAPQNAAAVLERTHLSYEGVYVDSEGALIAPSVMAQSLVEHLARWSKVVTPHGLILLEVHSLAPEVVGQFLDHSQNLHFDAYHAFSGRSLVEAELFLMAAAEVGLFPKAAFAGPYPRPLPFSDLTLNWFEKRAYTIRHARLSDLPALLNLEVAWDAPLRVSLSELRSRLTRFPNGQAVLEVDDRIVGVIYSQIIENPELLAKTPFAQIGSIHHAQGSVAQLLSINIFPEMQDMGLGDQLLTFMLQYFGLKGGIERIVAVTRCKSYRHHASIPMASYIQKRAPAGKEGRGALVDPILRFHEAHGAAIRGVVEDYRPEDVDNNGDGVLVEYDLRASVGRRETQVAGLREKKEQLAAQRRVGELPNALVGDALSAIVEESVQKVMRPGTPFLPKRPLMEMGLDSLGLLELRSLLNERLGVQLEPTFFFRYGTPDAIIRYFNQRSGRERADKKATTALRQRMDSHEAADWGQKADELQETVSLAKRASHEEEDLVAIIGMGCRFPGGVSTLEDYWTLLRDGVDAISEVPKSRWDITRYHGDQAGQIRSKYGGFVEQVDQFDAQFFRITPREAALIDPQQRLLLEVSWEALENAGLDPASLAGSKTGVFLGIFSHDYEQLQVRHSAHSEFGAYFATGTSASVAAGRVSYFLGLQGPSLSIDTACSSSLVALHLACQSLRYGESDLALASGVNLLLAPEISIGLSQAQMLSPEGRCRTFDAGANGYVRSEGCGVVVLKRLREALADNDNILAVVRGSAVNQDGTSNGLTAPNGLAQEAVIRQALAAANVAAHEVSYIEAHGTGTSLGDPIEVKALEAVYGEKRQKPLVIGSVKTNLGHGEAVAGIAGLIKVVLSLQHEQIPPHLHFKALNPHITLDNIPAVVPTEGINWAHQEEGRRIAGMSAFGFSGTNAHAIIEEAPRPPLIPPNFGREIGASLPELARQRIEGGRAVRHLFTLSAKSKGALEQLAQRYAAYLTSHPQLSLADVCFTANTGRSDFEHRLALVPAGHDVADSTLAEQLELFADGMETDDLICGEVSMQRAKVAFLFTGQGAQYLQMGCDLYESQAVFRAAMDRCDEILRPYLEEPLLSVLYSSPPTSTLLNQTYYTQPALFAIEYALAELWQSWGIEPAVVMGHSVGEYVAACVAGLFSLEDALKLIAARGRLMQNLPAGGEMVAIFADEQSALRLIEPYQDAVSIAGLNGPHNTVISGKGAQVQKILRRAEAEGLRTVELTVSHAFHSPLMEPMLAEFGRVAREITFSRPYLDIISNLTGELADDEIMTADYWVRHVRQAVRFKDGMETLHELGYDLFLELGPKPTLLGMGRRCLPNGVGTWLPSLRQGRPDWQQMLHSLGEFYVRGVPIAWADVYREQASHLRRVPLPTYAFQRERYWLNIGSHQQAIEQLNGSQNARQALLMAPQGLHGALHPLLGRRLHLAGLPEIRFESYLSQGAPAFLSDHRIFQSAIVPATGYLEMMLAAGSAIFKSESLAIEKVDILQPLILAEHEVKQVQVVLKKAGEQRYSCQIFSATQPEVTPSESTPELEWILHTSAQVLVTDEPPQNGPDLLTLQMQATEEIDIVAYYEQFHSQGMEYGPDFQAIRGLWRSSGADGEQALGQIRLPEGLLADANQYKLHPVLLDACLQSLWAIFPAEGQDQTYLPIGFERIRLYRSGQSAVWVKAEMRSSTIASSTLTADLQLFDESDNLVAEIEGLSVKRASRAALLRSLQKNISDWLYQVTWQPSPKTAPEEHAFGGDALGRWLIFADKEGFGQQVAAILREYGQESILIYARSNDFSRSGAKTTEVVTTSPTHFVIDPSQPQEFRRLLDEIAANTQRAGSEQAPLAGVLHLWSLEEEVNALASVLHLVQALVKTPLGAAQPPLWLVTRGVQVVDSLLEVGDFAPPLIRCHTPSPPLLELAERRPLAASQLWGLGKVIALEHPELACRRLDLASSPEAYDAHLLVEELMMPDQEEQIAYREGERYVARLSRLRLGAHQKQSSESGLDAPFRVTLDDYGILDNLHFAPLKRRQPAPNEVEIEVRATGLNFRDVLNALGMLKEYYAEHLGITNAADVPFGFECAGTIAAVGAQVSHLKVGDEVIASMATGSLASHLIVKASYVTHKPKKLTFEEAATIPLTFLTAYYGLHELAKIESGDRVLIHAASGGVGQAAVQLAQQAGAELFGTASPAKWEFVKASGVEHLMNSRTLEFAADVKRLTNGQGVDIVLNSLNAEFIDKSFEVLAEGGRFVEIGKIGIWDQKKVQEERPDASYFPFDLGEVSQADPELIPQMFNKLMAAFNEGTLAPLPLKVFPMSEVADAFRYMAQAKHIGKVVISQPMPKQTTSYQITNDKSYLITGGLGGLGLKVAHWLVAEGATHLVLTSRRGAASQAAQDALSQLQEAGADVHVVKADIAKEEDVARMLAEIESTMPPLHAIIHAAGVLDDGMLVQQSLERFERVMAPKVAGAWNLHTQLREHTQKIATQGEVQPLQIYFSSIASLIGSAGQGNYAAANAFMDALAHHRQQLGLPTLSINWGAWAEVGMAASMSQRDQNRLASQGIGMITPEEGLQLLGQLLAEGTDLAQVGVLPMNWSKFMASLPKDTNFPFLETFASSAQATPNEAMETTGAASKSKLLAELEAAPMEERKERLSSYITQEVAKVIGLGSNTDIAPRQRLFDLGIDSLMAVELRNRLESTLGQSLRSTLLFDYPTVEALVKHLAQDVLPAPLDEEEEADADFAEELEQLAGLSDVLDDMSDDDLATLLADKLLDME